ncbi:MAG: amidohydrolase [Bacteroidales bacterium]|nr:amidohydrolase [Clostridium sp.]MCM1203022.1 amidohydrolase [Bacteroidales bacterium]
MRIRLYDARILTMERGEEPFWGEVWIKEDTIEKVIHKNPAEAPDRVKTDGEKADGASDGGFDEQIDCMGNLLMPGFKNCHAHGPMTFLRSYADDLPLQEWLQSKIFPAEARLTREDIYYLMQLAVLEYIRNGITTSFEMYFHPEMIAKACIDLGFRVVLSGTVFGAEEKNVKEAVDTLVHDYTTFHQCHSLVDYRLGFHSEYSCCKELLVQIAKLSRQYEAPVFMHNSETGKEVTECMSRYGMTPVQFMDSIGLFEYGGAGHHLVYTDERDMEILKAKGLYAVTNPSSNLKLASGVAPIKEYLERGIPVAIGTDGPASNNSLNFFKEMYLTAALQKIKYRDAAAVSPADVLAMATVNGAGLLGLKDCDRIAEGKQADIILIDLLKPNMQPVNHLVNNLVYSGGTENVIMTMIAGNILYVNGTYRLKKDPVEVYKRANYIIRRIECEMA